MGLLRISVCLLFASSITLYNKNISIHTLTVQCILVTKRKNINYHTLMYNEGNLN